jgi:hypothetical protein
VIHRLYFSPAVDAVTAEGTRALAVFNIYADRMIEEGRRPPAYREEFKDRSSKIEATDGISARMLDAMRADMQGGG